MAIKPINNISFLGKKFIKSKNDEPITNYPEKNIPKTPDSSSLGLSKVYLDQINALKTEADMYANDVEYRKNLMVNAGLNSNEYYKLRSIIGSDEIKVIMKEFNENENFYSAGEKDINIKNKTIRANLHIHTLASDGALTVKKLLDKAAGYANEVAQKPENKKMPFTIAITDHDTTESAKEAINIILKDPVKYKNLRIILGTEITTYNNIARQIVDKATNTHVLVYGIDPNEKTFDNFINETKNKKSKIAQKMINEANKIYKKVYEKNNDLFSLDEAKNFFNPINKNILGIYNYINTYLQTKTIIEESVIINPAIMRKLHQKGLYYDTNDIINAMKDYFYIKDKNNKPRQPMDFVCKYLSKETSIPYNEIQSAIIKGPEQEKFNLFKSEIDSGLEKYKRTFKPHYNYMPALKSVYLATKNQKSTLIGLAHPLDTINEIENKKDIIRFLKSLYVHFSQVCKEKAVFSEVYYQSYTEKLNTLKTDIDIKNLLNILSKKLSLFKTGSADTHGLNIFKRHF